MYLHIKFLNIINTYLYFKTMCVQQQQRTFVVGTQPERSRRPIVRGRNPTAARRDATLVRFSRYGRVPSAHTVGGGVVTFTTFGRRRSRWSTPTRALFSVREYTPVDNIDSCARTHYVFGERASRAVYTCLPAYAPT